MNFILSRDSNSAPVSGTQESSRSRRHHPDEARKLIIQTAYSFLWDAPFRDLTVARLMAKTTLSRPSFYQYFDDLDQLAELLLQEIQNEMLETTDPWIHGQGEPISALREALGGVVQSCVKHGPVLRAIAEAAPLDERLEQAWSLFMNNWDVAVAARIKAQQTQGLIRSSLDSALTARALNAMDASLLLDEFGRRPQGDPDAVLDTIHGIWVASLYSQPRKRIRVPE